MKLLLDTHLLLWAAAGAGLPQAALTLIEDEQNELWFSAASIWEVAIKNSLGRADFTADPHLLRRGLLDNGYQDIQIRSNHAAFVSSLPKLHKDPFDRLLIVQANLEEIILLTCDEIVAAYPGPIQLM